MHVFVTGASGWVGSEVVRELVARGHRVTGLVRSESRMAGVQEMGATPLLGTIENSELLATTANNSDAVIHTAFNHDFSKFAENSELDRRTIETLGGALAGSDRPLIVTSGLAGLAPGEVATEEFVPSASEKYPRKSEAAARALAEKGVRVSTMRLPPSVHGVGDYGFVPMLAQLAREKGVSAYIGEGLNRWPAVHRLDAARVYVLALEEGVTLPAYHAIAEEAVLFRDIAEVIGRQLGLPVESRDREHFGWFGGFAGMDAPASSARTRALLNWTPSEIGLIEDLDQAAYYQPTEKRQ